MNMPIPRAVSAFFRVPLLCLFAGLSLGASVGAQSVPMSACPEVPTCFLDSFFPRLQAGQALSIRTQIREAGASHALLELDLLLSPDRFLAEVIEPRRFSGIRILQHQRQSWLYMAQLARPVPVLPAQLAASDLWAGLPYMLARARHVSAAHLQQDGHGAWHLRLPTEADRSAAGWLDVWGDSATGRALRAEERNTDGVLIATLEMSFSDRSGQERVPSEIRVRRLDGQCCDRDIGYSDARVVNPGALAFSLTDLVRP